MNNNNIQLYHIDGINMIKIITKFEDFFVNKIIIPTIKDLKSYDDDSYFENIIYYDKKYEYPINGYFSFEWKKLEEFNNDYNKAYCIKIYYRPGYENPDNYINGINAHQFISEYMVWYKNE